jgi:hypothetical protein
MSEDFGNGVSRTLSALARQFQAVIWQDGKPPLDSELNLVAQVDLENMRQLVRSQVNSGFFLDPTQALRDFVTDPLNSNQFRFGTQERDDDGAPEELDPVVYASVNGWVIPITGSFNPEENATDNIIKLNPPPDSDSRIDFVFLEAWTVQVAPNPSTANKPSQSEIWKYGNVDYGQTNINDDIEDPAIGYETTERVQLQYRIRIVGSGSGAGTSPSLDIYPDGLGDPNVFAQGPNSSITTFTYENMRKELLDPSLWRAGDGDPTNASGTNTTDGYIYAVPICAVFRRNSSPYVAASLAGAGNQNGAFNRNPSAQTLPVPQDGAKLLTQASLTNDLAAEQFTLDTTIELDNLIGSGWDDPNLDLSKTFLIIDNEVMSVSAVDTVASPATVTVPAGGRGRWGSDIVFHAGRSDPAEPGSGTAVQFFNTRPSIDGPVAPGPYSDEVAEEDILDLRRGLNFGDWDYERLILHNISALIRNRLRSTWKAAGAPGGDTEGVSVTEVDYLLQDGGTAVPFGTEALDGPDGIRQVFSDAAALQGDVTMLLDNEGTMNAGFIQTFDDLVTWDVGADFKPAGFMNNLNNTNPGFTNGSTIFVYIGGEDGTQGARKTFRDGSTRAVRFVSPKEYWKANTNGSNGLQTPVSLTWVSSDVANAGAPAEGGGLQALSNAGPGEVESEHPGPMYPLQFLGFEKPFIVLGGILNDAFVVTGIDGATQLIGNSLDGSIPLGEGEIVFPGFDFNAVGDWFSYNEDGKFANDPSTITNPVLRGQRTLFDMLTAGLTDRTGNSSEVYLVLFGDDSTTANNGAFKVIGAGNATDVTGTPLTTNPASASNRIRVKFLGREAAAPFAAIQDFDNTSTKTVTAEVRSMVTNAEDGVGSALGPAAMTITLTDITAIDGGGSNPWNEANINPTLAANGRTLQAPFDYKCLVNTTLQYHPGRGAMARVPDQIENIAIQAPVSTILRQSRAFLDPTFPNDSGAPGNPNEVDYCPTHIQTWNRLPSLGLWQPDAPAYGGNVVLFSEVTRENESFFDNGSKTLLFRPFQLERMTTKGVTILPDPSPIIPGNTPTLLGAPTVINPENQDNYPNPSLIPTGWDGPKDDAQIFTVGLKMGYPVPPQYMPRFGRQDIPYYQDNGPAFGTNTFLEGINHLFCDGTDLTNPVFDIIGGDDNQSGGTLVTRFLMDTGPTSGLDYGQYGTITGTTSQAYHGRLTTEIGTGCVEAEEITTKLANVTSSDFGTGLRGIQFPPYLGPARIYGVYDRRDFVAKGAVTFQADRVTPEPNAAVNLMRRDATKQTLFICEDGAYDLTANRGDHTYIIPENLLDITKSPSYVAGETFTDLEYVVEFTAFGFANGFIDKNNYVMARRHNGVGTLRADTDNPELEGMSMCIPAAAPDSSRVYVDYQRTVYQGDPYMSRDGATRVTSDYENRYGQVAQSDAVGLNNSIQQFDAAGNTIPEIPNARAFQIVAALDFYTTLGSGNIGGTLYPGTVTDVGYTNNSLLASTRIPPSADTPSWRILNRAFTEGQKSNTSRAQGILEITGNNATFDFATPSQVTITRLDGVAVVLQAINGPATPGNPNFDASSPDPAVIARSLFIQINALSDLASTLRAFNDIDSPQIELVAWPVGADGNQIQVEINDTTNFLLKGPTTGEQGLNAVLTSIFLAGGQDLVLNAGNGTTQLDLSGMTERFPLGILVSDSDFLGENPLNDEASAVQTVLGGLRPVQTLLPLTKSAGAEYTRFTGTPGEVIEQSDGSILQYTAFSDTNPGGSKRFRLFRGGGANFMLSGKNPGGPVDWFSDSLPASFLPVLKGGLLACKALLVRNYHEEAFSTEDVTSDGDELQMVILTNAVYGNVDSQKDGVTLDGIISPTGYGEGYAASDRYRLNGKPMYKGRVRTHRDPNDVTMAFYPGRDNDDS